MLKLIHVMTIAGLTLMSLPHAFASQSPFWTPNDGETLNFDVLRQGKPFGKHIVTFDVEDNQINVQNEIELKVNFGPVQVFYYGHQSEENWVNGQLSEMAGETTKSGDVLTLKARRTPEGLEVNGSGFSGLLPADMIPSSHWNIQQVRSSAILSSENGEVLDIRVENLGEETILAGGTEIIATRYRLRSDLTVDLWYDANGRWVKCAFEARNQKIEYVLRG